MTKQNQDFEMWSGNNEEVVVTVKDGSGNTIDITGSSIEWVVKEKPSSSSALVSKYTPKASGIELSDASNGEFKVLLDPDDTNGLGGGIYYHEAELTDNDDNVSTVMTGEATIHIDGVS